MLAKIRDIIQATRTIDNALSFHDREDSESFSFRGMINNGEQGIERLADLLNIGIEQARKIAQREGCIA